MKSNEESARLRYTARKILSRTDNFINSANGNSNSNNGGVYYNNHLPSLETIQSRFNNNANNSNVNNDSIHPLQHPWTLFYDSKSSNHGPTDKGSYEAGLNIIGDMKTVEDFCRMWNWCKPPSKLERYSNYHIFKDGIKPLWEDPSNANVCTLSLKMFNFILMIFQGGKWVIIVKNNNWLLDRCWSWLVMALVGEELDEDDKITGAG